METDQERQLKTWMSVSESMGVWTDVDGAGVFIFWKGLGMNLR